MQPVKQGGFGFSGLEYFGPREYWNVIRRSKWLILSLTLGTALLTSVVVHFIPNTYRATTVVLVDPRKVPDSVVMSTVTSGIGDRLATLRQQVLSTSRLGQIIDSMNLYSDMRGKKSKDELIERMRKDIEVEIMANGGSQGMGAFKISFNSRDPVQAAAVTNKLASVFIEENVKAREQEVVGTAEFIDHELEDANRDLKQKEDMIRNIKTQYASSLPESQLAHVQAINSGQIELRSELDAMARAQQQKVYLQNSPQPVVKSDPTQPAPLEAQLTRQEAQLQDLRARYGDNHPDVRRLRTEVQDLRQRASREVKSSGSSSSKGTAQRPLDAQLAVLDDEIKSHQRRSEEVRKQISMHQQKIDQMPVLEQQLAAVMRDYETARDHYKMLLDRKFAADMSSNLETYQKGERFVVLDPAQVPKLPSRPNRFLLDVAGLAVGLGLSLLLAVFLELNDSTVKTEAEILSYVEAPVMAELPWIMTNTEQHRKRKRTTLGLAINGAMGVAYVCMVLFVR